MQHKKKFSIFFALVILAVIISNFSSQAAQTNELAVRCNITQVRGTIDTTAPYVRVQIVLASDLTQVLAIEEAEVHRNGNYNAVLHYPQQADNTLLVVTLGEWDGQQYLYPATIQSRYCNQTGGTAPQITPEPGYPTPVPTNQSAYYIDYFYSDFYAVEEGGCVTLSYWVVGAESINIFSSNWNDPIVVNNNPGQQVMCPYGSAGTSVSYILQANFLDGSFATQQIDVQIVGGDYEPTPAPTQSSYYIAYFSSDIYAIQSGGCVTLSYWAVGAQEIDLYSNWEPNPTSILDNPNQRIVCPSITVNNVPNDSVTYVLDVIFLDGSQESAYITIQVNQ